MKAYRIIFVNNDVHLRWAARAGGDKREILIPGNWWSSGYDQKFHFEHLVADETLRGLLSRDDRTRFESAYKIYAEVTDGNLVTEGTQHDQKQPGEPATSGLLGA